MRVNPPSWPLLSSVLVITTIALNSYVEGDSNTAGDSFSNRDLPEPRTSLTKASEVMSSIHTGNARNIDVVFSDLDGTLIHYPKQLDEFLRKETSKGICVLPSSSTGMVGVLSTKTLHLVGEIRKTGVKFVLVSGMRASTLLKRLPYLPRADAYCCEAGGRIFYPTYLHMSVIVNPKEFRDAAAEDLHPFSLIEDMEWRRRIEHADAAGMDGYVGQDLTSAVTDVTVPITKRRGKLWDFARSLAEQGFTLDTVGYTTCFRVNRMNQKNSILFDKLTSSGIEVPAGLSTSTNLGCIDFYPVISGKKNCCDYLSKKFCPNDEGTFERCLCLCDDDNDIEMALSCLHAYLPLITSASMEDCVKSHPSKFTVISFSKDSQDGIEATEMALSLVLERLKRSR